jgi:hypothetical protein
MKMKRFVLLIVLTSLYLASCKDDYRIFDTRPAFVVGKPKIRFLNLHFAQTRITVTIGGGKLVKENLVRRSLTAYEELADDLREQVPYIVTDSAGNELLRDTLTLQEGKNFTLVIFPAYNGIISDYQVPNNGLRRYMQTMIPGRARAALLADPLTPPFVDRAAVRQVYLSPDLVFNPNNAALFRMFPVRTDVFANYFRDYTEPPVIPTRPEVALPPALPQTAFLSFEYGVVTPGDYFSTWGGVPDLGYLIGPNTQGLAKSGKELPLATFTPYTLQAGRSYTVLLNGTVGQSNDVITPLQVRTPLPLRPIPYEAFVLDDADG